MQRTIYTLKEERDTAVQNFQAVLQTIPEPTAPPAKPSTAYRDLLLPYRFDVIGLYSRRTTYHRVIESMHGTLSKFWEGMDDRVPDRLSADAVIIDATHVHHSTLHRVVYPTEKIFLADPSGLALREALIRWATHLSPEQEVPLPS
jgi:hypothetical protein